MSQRFFLIAFLLCPVIVLFGCSTVQVPEKLSSIAPAKGRIYVGQLQEELDSKGKEKQPADRKRKGVNEKSKNAATDGSDVLQPRPLGDSDQANQADGSSVDVDGRLPGFKQRKGANPGNNLDKLAAGEIVHLDYDQVDLRTILEEIADSLGITLLIDPAIQGKVTMRTSPSRPLHKRDLWPVLQLLVSQFGVSLEKKGNVFHATSKPVTLPGQMGMLDKFDDSATSGGQSLQFLALQNVSQETVLPVLSALLGPQGKILSLPNLNVIGVIAQPYIQKRIAGLVPLLDADPFKYRGIRLFRLNKAKSTDVAADLEKILKLIEGEKTTFSVLDLKRLNSLLVVAPPERGFQQVERWIGILDNESGTDTEQVFVYHVKNLQAKNLAATLSETFSPQQRAQETRLSKKITEKYDKKNIEKNDKNKRKDDKSRKVKKKEITTVKEKEYTPISGQGTSANIQLKIVADEDTNSLLVRSTANDYQQLLQTIALLDTPPLEVMCNIVIAEVLLNESNEFGIDWYLLSKYGDALLGTPFDITDGGNIPDAVNRNIMETPFELTGTFTKTGIVMEGVGGGRLGFVLKALSSVGNLKVLSRPSILVRNNQEAVIKVGTEEPTLTSVTNSDIISGGQTAIQNDVQYRDTGIILTVKPHITKDGIINMEVNQEISKLGENRTVYDLPSFDSSKLTTSVVVQNGTAIILGGIIRTQQRAEQDGIPLLSDLPVLGPLFATTKNEENRYELVLIIVPEIVNPEVNNSRLVKGFFAQMKKVAELIDEQIGRDNFFAE